MIIHSRDARTMWRVVCALAAFAAFATGCSSGRSPEAAPPATRGAPTLGATVQIHAAGPPRLGTINRNLIGVDGPGPPEAATALRALGLHWVRADVGFEGTTGGSPVYDCATGQWNPVLTDQRVAGIRREQGTPLLIVDYSPPCLTADGRQSSPPDIGANRSRWMALVRSMALHEIAEGVRYFEVWNEPDWIFFSGGRDAYLQLYADTAVALESAARSAGQHIYVGGPALADVLDTQDLAWLDPLLVLVSTQSLPLDFISWHAYPNDPLAGPTSPGSDPICLGRPPGPGSNPCYYNPALDEGTLATEVAQTRRALAPYPALHPLLIADEWNLDGEGDPRQDQPFDASYAAAVLDSLQSAGIDGSCFFDTENSATNPDQNWGLLWPGGRPKPVYQTFLFWHMMKRERIASTVTAQAPAPGGATSLPPNDVGRIGAVASRDATGDLTVLLYNFKPFDAEGDYGARLPTRYDRQIIIEIDGLPHAHYRIATRQVDALHGGEVTPGSSMTTRSGTLDLRVNLPGEGVALLTLSVTR